MRGPFALWFFRINLIFSRLLGNESDGEDAEPDLFQCGKCKQMFISLQKYLKHKAAKDCVQLQAQRVVTPVTNGEVNWQS